MNILITIDDNFVIPTINMFKSLHMYNEDTIFDVYLLFNNLSDTSIKKLKENINDSINVKLNFIKKDFSKKDFPMNISHISRETYFRLYAPFLLPNEMERILYLDCDIICNGNIEDLYNIDFDDNIVAGVKNIDPDPTFLEYINGRLGLPLDNEYINAGVLLINLPLYREYVDIEKIERFINENYEILMCQDQDVINKMFFNKIKVLGDEYNYQINHIDSDKLDYDSKKLIHYLSPPKPWKDDYYLPFHGVIFYRYLLKIDDFCTCDYLIKKHISNANLDIYNIKLLLDLVFKKK